MTESKLKGHIPGSNSLQQQDGFEKPDSLEAAAGTAGDVDPAVAPDPVASTRSTQSSTESDLYQDALESAVALKKKHVAFYAADPKGFSRIVRKANGAAFRRKPGPAPDPRIVHAAAEHTSGAKWSDLYPKYIIGYEKLKDLNPGTCDDAEAGFRRKVYDYRRRDPRLKTRRRSYRKSDRKGHRRYKEQRRPPDPNA